jgi:peptidyl-prolyl cis-trans isomerase B (cyclophilin B)
MRSVYASEGGAPNLDQQYTVFGQLVEGFEVLDAIANTPTPNRNGASAPPNVADRPIQDVPMMIRPLPDYE